MKGKKRFIVLLLTLSMVLSQMSVVTFAVDSVANDSDQTVTEQAVEETQPAAEENADAVTAEPEKVEAEETAPATEPEKEEPEEAAFDQSETVDGVKVTVKAAKGVFPAGAKLSVKKVAVPKAVDTKDAEEAYAFDISILVDGKEVQPDGKAEVSFTTAEVKKYDTEVFHMDGKKPEALDVTESGKTATVETEGFSTYVLVFTVVDPKDPEKILDYSYTMGEDQSVPLSEIITGSMYDPTFDHGQWTEGGETYQLSNTDVTYSYSKASVSDSSKLEIIKDGVYKVRTVDNASFNDGESLTITIPWKYEFGVKTETNFYTKGEETGNAIIKISVSSVDGNIVPPTPEDVLVYNGLAQVLLKTTGSSTVAGVTFEYKVDNEEAWSEWNVSYAPKATDVGTHTVYWRAMGDNGAVDSGEVTVTIEDVSFEEPVAAEGLVYDGNDQILIANPAGIDAEGIDIYYAITGVNADTPTGTSNWKKDYRAPALQKADAGDYWIWYRAGYMNGGSWVDVVGPAHIDASIDKAEFPVEIETKGTLAYNGSEQVLVREENQPTTPFEIKYSVNEGEWKVGVNSAKGKEVGEYSIRWKFEGNKNYYPASGEVEAEIADYTLTPPEAAEGLAYTGEAQVLISTVASTDISGATIQYAVTDKNAAAPESGWDADYTKATKTDAGDYWIWYRVCVSDNVVAGPAHIDVSIDKAECPVEVETVGTLKFNGSAQQLIRVLNNNNPHFAIQYSINDGPWVAGADAAASNITGTDPGEYSIRWKYAGDVNYYPASGEVEAEIADYYLTPPTAVEGLVYNGDDQILIDERATTDIEGATIEYVVTDENAHTPRNGWDSNFRHATAEDAGNYWLWYRVRVGNTTVVEPAHIDASIDKAECPVEVETVGKLPYTGRAQDLVRVLNNDDPEFVVNYSVNDGAWGTDLPQGTETGDYSIRWRIAESDNYYGASGEVETTIADFTFVEPVADDTLVYNGSAQVLIKEPGSIDLDGLSIEYARTDVNASAPFWGWTENYASLTGTNAGDYWIWYRVQYGPWYSPTTIVEPGHITAMIKKADCPVEVESTGTLLYSGEEQVLVRELNNPDGQGHFTLQYSVNDGGWFNGTEGAANVTGTEVGSYSIRWKYAGDNNYNPASGTVNTYIVEVDKMFGKATYTDADEDGVWVFDGKKHGATVKAYVLDNSGEEKEVTNGVKVYYSLDTLLTADNYKTAGTTSPTGIYPKNAGDYTIYYYITAPDYEDAAGSVDVTIDKAYLRISVVDKMTTYGDFVKYNKIKYNEATKDGYIKVEAFEDQDFTKEWQYVEGSINNINQFRFDTDGYTNYMSDAGTYYITVEDNLDSDNYIISYISGKLTVTKKQLSFIWSNPQEWNYDGQPHRIDAHIDTKCLVGSDADDESLVTFKYTSDQVGIYTNEATNVLRVKSTTDPDTDWEVGDYIARIEELRGSRSSNYTIYVLDKKGAETDVRVESAQETFRINPVDLTLTPNDVTTIFGDEAKDNGYSATGLVNNEKAEDVLLGTPTYEFVDYYPGVDVGKYDIKITNVEDPNTTKSLHAQNYTVKTEPNVKGHNVVPREVTMIWSKPQTFEYDGQYHYVRVVEADNDFGAGTVNSVLFNSTLSNEKKVNAGSYTAAVTVTDRAGKNYKILDNSDKCKWTITKRPATIYANSNSIVYGQAPADKGYYIDNKPLVKNVENDNKLDSIGTVTLKHSYVKNGKPGTYAITPVVTNLNPNYYIAAYKAGTLTVSDKVTELVAQGKTKGKKAAMVTWNTVSGATSYDIYWSKCNVGKKKYTPKYIGTAFGNAYKVKKLEKGVSYKFYVVAKDASGNPIAVSPMGHFIIGNVMGKYTNPKAITPSTNSVTVSAGGVAQVSTKITKVKKDKNLLNGKHTQKLRYFSSNPEVAVVAQNGVIAGVAPGWCKVYAVATDGMWSVIEVNVQ